MTTLPQALFFLRKMAPIFLESAGSVVVVGVCPGSTNVVENCTTKGQDFMLPSNQEPVDVLGMTYFHSESFLS